MIGNSGSHASPPPLRSPGPLGPYGGCLSLFGFSLSMFLFVWAGGWLIEFFAAATLGTVLLVAVLVAVAAALVVFEFAHRLPWTHPLRRLWAQWDTVRRTAVESLVAPAGMVMLLAIPAIVVFELLFGGNSLGAALAGATLTPFTVGRGLEAFAAALAVATAFVAAWNLSHYLVGGRAFLTTTLAKYAPQEPALLAQTPVRTLRFYHTLLRLSGAAAFAFELVFQILAFGVVTWGVATGLPRLGLFENAEAATLTNTTLYWLDRVFALVDGQDTFGFSFSPLEANRAIWAFGFAVLFFKLFAVAMIFRLFQDSLHLRPHDISPTWGNAVERDAA